jgi:hypothetical protein
VRLARRKGSKLEARVEVAGLSVYHAVQNHLTLPNGAQIAAGALGVGASMNAAKGLIKPRAAAPSPDAPTKATPSRARTEAPTTEFRAGKQWRHAIATAYRLPGGAAVDADWTSSRMACWGIRAPRP